MTDSITTAKKWYTFSSVLNLVTQNRFVIAGDLLAFCCFAAFTFFRSACITIGPSDLVFAKRLHQWPVSQHIYWVEWLKSAKFCQNIWEWSIDHRGNFPVQIKIIIFGVTMNVCLSVCHWNIFNMTITKVPSITSTWRYTRTARFVFVKQSIRQINKPYSIPIP